MSGPHHSRISRSPPARSQPESERDPTVVPRPGRPDTRRWIQRSTCQARDRTAASSCATPRHRRDRLHRRPAGAPSCSTPGTPCAAWPAAPDGCATCPWAGRRRGRRRATLLEPRTPSRRACDGVDVAYYLVHSLGRRDFEETRPATRRTIFAAAARDGRRAPDRLPRRPRPPATATLVGAPALARRGRRDPAATRRADGRAARRRRSSAPARRRSRCCATSPSGCRSWSRPRWVDNRIQPIAIRDVLRYLVGAAGLPAEVNRALRHRRPRRPDLPRDDAALRRGRRAAGPRVIVPVPVLTPAAVAPLGRPGHAGAARDRRARWSSRWCTRSVCREHDIARRTCPTRPDGLHRLRRGRRAGAGARSATPTWRPAGRRASGRGAPSDPLPTDPDWAGGTRLHRRARARPCDAHRRRAVAGHRGHRRRDRLVLVPAGLVGARLAGPARRRGRAAPRPARPATGCWSATRWTSGGSRRSSPDACCGCAPRCGCRAGPGWSCGATATTGEGTRLPRSAPSSSRAAWPGTLYWWAVAPVPRRRLRRHGPQHRAGRRTGHRSVTPATPSACRTAIGGRYPAEIAAPGVAH